MREVFLQSLAFGALKRSSQIAPTGSITRDVNFRILQETHHDGFRPSEGTSFVLVHAKASCTGFRRVARRSFILREDFFVVIASKLLGNFFRCSPFLLTQFASHLQLSVGAFRCSQVMLSFVFVARHSKPRQGSIHTTVGHNQKQIAIVQDWRTPAHWFYAVFWVIFFRSNSSGDR